VPKKPLFTRKTKDRTAKNQIEKIVFNYRFTGNSRIEENDHDGIQQKQKVQTDQIQKICCMVIEFSDVGGLFSCVCDGGGAGLFRRVSG
jgi:hypothetical protein